jgi:hypothetical protein
VRRDVTFEEEVSFRRSRGSYMEIDSERQEEMVPSPPHPPTVQRETIEPIDPIDLVDPVALVDVPRDIAVGQKRPAWALVRLCRRKKDMQLLVVPSERERDLRDICAMLQL